MTNEAYEVRTLGFIKRAVVQSYGVASWLRSWMGPCMGSAVGNTFR